MAVTTTKFLEGVERRMTMPASQVLLTDVDILGFADDVIRTELVPLMIATQQDFFVTKKLEPILASQTLYDIPYRAAGRTLREIKMVEPGGDRVRNLVKMTIEETQYYMNNAYTMGFFLEGDQIHLVPDITSSYAANESLEIWFKVQPSQLISTNQACQVIGIADDTVTVDQVPSSITSLTPIDFIQGRSGNRLYAMDVQPLGTGVNTLTFDPEQLPAQLRAGDWIALAAQSPVFTMIPDECVPFVETLTAQRGLYTIGDNEGAQALEGSAAKERRALETLLEPRVDGAPTVIMNRSGLVRGNRFGRQWLYYGRG